MASRHPLLTFLVILTAPLVAVGADPGIEPVGGEFQVNTVTSGSQVEPAVAALGQHGFFVVRVSASGYGGFKGRVFSKGQPVGGEFGVASASDESYQEFRPAVAALPDGGVVVVWARNDLGPADREVAGRFFAATGAPLGLDFAVNSATPGLQDQPSVAATASGEILVTWREEAGATMARRFAANGLPLGSETSLQSSPGCGQSASRSAPVRDDGFLVVWRSDDFTCGDDARGLPSRIAGRSLNSLASPVGDELLVGLTPDSASRDLSLATDSTGQALVVWDETRVSEGDIVVWARGYDPDGEPLGEQIEMTCGGTSRGNYGDVAAVGRSDRFLVAWDGIGASPDGEETCGDGNGSGVVARLIGPEGLGSTLLVNEYTLGSQNESAVAVARDGSVMIVWVGPSGVGDDVSGTAILGRFFRTVLFRDGFESGGTGAWTLAARADMPGR